jgi:symplekin
VWRRPFEYYSFTSRGEWPSQREIIIVLISSDGSRGPHGMPFAQQINEALAVQGARIDKASSDEKARRIATAAAAAESTKKRPLPASNETSDAKRQKLEPDATGSSAAFLAGFDFTSLPAALITELVVANLQAFAEPELDGLVAAYRDSRGTSPTSSALAAPAVLEPASTTAKNDTAPSVKQEPIDPLKMDIDEEEMEYEPDKLNMEVRCKNIVTLQ